MCGASREGDNTDTVAGNENLEDTFIERGGPPASDVFHGRDLLGFSRVPRYSTLAVTYGNIRYCKVLHGVGGYGRVRRPGSFVCMLNYVKLCSANARPAAYASVQGSREGCLATSDLMHTLRSNMG